MEQKNWRLIGVVQSNPNTILYKSSTVRMWQNVVKMRSGWEILIAQSHFFCHLTICALKMETNLRRAFKAVNYYVTERHYRETHKI